MTTHTSNPTAHDRSLRDFPAAYGEVVTERHARLCREEGHKTWIRDGVDVGRCARCGDVTEVPVHQRPDSCFVCGAPTTDAGRPSCSHDWTVAEAFAEAREHDRRATVRYSTGATSAEALYVDETRGR